MKKILFLAMLSCFVAPIVQAVEAFQGGRGIVEFNGSQSYYEFKDGEFVWYEGDQIFVKSTYTINGKYLIITDISGPRACIYSSNDIEVGIYSWVTMDNGEVYLKVVDDDCLGRQQGFLAASPITKL